MIIRQWITRNVQNIIVNILANVSKRIDFDIDVLNISVTFELFFITSHGDYIISNPIRAGFLSLKIFCDAYDLRKPHF